MSMNGTVANKLQYQLDIHAKCRKYASAPPRHLLVCILQKMPRNPKCDPFHKVKVAPKAGKSTDHDQHLISIEGGQDTPACQIAGCSLHAFSGKCPEIPNLARFTKSKWHQKEENQQTMIKISSDWKVVRIHQHAKLQAIPSMRSPGNARKPHIWPISLNQSRAKRRKINRPWPNSNQFWRWSGYISMQNCRPFPPCNFLEMPGNPSRWTDGRTDGRTTRKHNASGAWRRRHKK